MHQMPRNRDKMPHADAETQATWMPRVRMPYVRRATRR